MNSGLFKLPKDLVKFFRDFDIPQIIILNLGSEALCKDQQSNQRFICNSVILALHSDRFERIISAGTQEIFIEGFGDETGVDTVRACIEFMYGDHSTIDWCDDICGMCKFADTWEIPSLWNACLKWIECQLHQNPVELLDYLDPKKKFVNLKLSHCFKMDALFDRVRCLNADILIERILELRGDFDFEDQLFIQLIENSETSVCGEFILFLLVESEETRKFIMRNLHILPIHTAFPNESMMLKFRNLMLFQAGDNEYKCNHNGNRYRSAPAENRESSHSQSVQPVTKGDDNASIMELAFRSGGHNDQSSKVVLDVSVPVSNRGTRCSVSDDNNADPVSSQIHEKTPSFSGAVCVADATLSEERKRLFLTCVVSVKDYPSKVRDLTLYSGLEAIAHLVSKRNLTDKNLTFLLLPYFKNHMVAASILEDLKCIALKRCSSQKNSVKESLSKALEIDMKGRLETFSVSNYCYHMADFLDNLEVENRISLNLDHGVLCQICHDKSATIGKAKAKKSAKQMKCIFQGLEIDISSEKSIDFVADEEFHKDHLIHCYIVGLSADGTPISYISIMQLTVPEVIEELKDKVAGVKTVVIFSKTAPANSSLFQGLLV